MNTSITHPEVAAFVAAVRRALDDLTPDEIDDLTGNLPGISGIDAMPG